LVLETFARKWDGNDGIVRSLLNLGASWKKRFNEAPGNLIFSRRFLYEKQHSGRPFFFAGRLLNLLRGKKASKLRFLKIYFVEVKLGISRTNTDSQWNLVYNIFHRICSCGNESIGW